MNKTQRKLPGFVLTLAAAGLLAASLKLPLWHMRMEAPQYRDEEALRVHVYPTRMSGDLREINVLNQYIGVHAPSELPQFKWLPIALVAGAAAGVLASFSPRGLRRVAIGSTAIAVATAVGVAALQAKQQMHDIGHKRDAHTKLARVQNFDAPLLGTAKIAQFTVTSRLGLGAYLIGAAVALQLGAAAVNRFTPCGVNCRCAARARKTEVSNPREVLV